jgi:hypothetical protein
MANLRAADPGTRAAALSERQVAIALSALVLSGTELDEADRRVDAAEAAARAAITTTPIEDEEPE